MPLFLFNIHPLNRECSLQFCSRQRVAADAGFMRKKDPHLLETWPILLETWPLPVALQAGVYGDCYIGINDQII